MNRCLQLFFFIVTLNFVPDSGLKAETHELNGQYFHKPTGKYLYIEIVNNGLILKDRIEDTWQHFPRVRRGLFIDRLGNRVEVRDKNEIIFVARRSTRGLIYKKVYQHFNQSAEEKDYRSQDTKPVNTKTMEGLWYDNVSQMYLIVVETREGIKVRLKDERIWYPYDNKDSGNTYISKENNRYEFNDGKLLYFHNGADHFLSFDKISDSFDGY